MLKSRSQPRLSSSSRISVLFNEPKLLKCLPNAHKLPSRRISVLFNEPKLLKSVDVETAYERVADFSALQRAEIAEIASTSGCCRRYSSISVLFNEPKLLKCTSARCVAPIRCNFSALQRAEIAEMLEKAEAIQRLADFSALQRAEIAEIAPRLDLPV